MSLGDFATLQRGYDLPDHKREDGPVPILGSFGITGRHSTARVKSPGVTIGRSGSSFGVVSYSPVDFWPLNTALYVKDFHGNSARFAYYFFKQFDFSSFNSGSAQPSLNRNVVHPVKIRIPGRDEQILIASFLGELDDRIELLRQTNETLEAMARAIFKSWFVDFDPVRAKAEGREPEGMDAATAALFASEFQDSQLGPIPEGWSIKKFGDEAQLAYGKALKAENRSDGTIRVMGSNGQIGWHDQKLVSGPGIVIGRKGNPGTVEWVQDDFFPIDTTFYVKTQGNACDLHYLHQALCRLNLPSLSADSAVPGLNRSAAYGAVMVLPPESLRSEFALLSVQIRKRIACNGEHSSTLAELRDILLPRLISGKLRVPEAEAMLAEVG